MKVAMFPISGPSMSAATAGSAGASAAGAGSGSAVVSPEFLEMAETIFGDKNNMDEQKMEKGESLLLLCFFYVL